MTLRRSAVAVLPLVLLAASCGGSSSPGTAGSSSSSGPSGIDPSTFVAEVASTDLYPGAPQRVQVGVFSSDPELGILLVTGGTVSVRLAPGVGGEGMPVEGEARYVAAPGTPSETTASLTAPSEARGVYELGDVSFDAAGVWEAEVTATVGGTAVTVADAFAVVEEPALPAPGQPALATDNLTLDSKGVDPVAVDSRALDGRPVPDPELHQDTIAQALKDGRPVLALFATPVYCMSQFCGPTVEALAELAATGPKDVAYIHIEIWNDFEASVVNKAAADWLLRNEDLTEPWLFLIGADGTILDRWGPLFDVDEVRAEIATLAPA